MRICSTSLSVLVLLFSMLPCKRSSSEPLDLRGVLRQVVVDADTCMYFTSGDKQYLLDSWPGVEAGDCVLFAGERSNDCDSQCEERDGCLHPTFLTVVYGCEFSECGRLSRGLGECLYFESSAVGKYLLSDQGGFSLGDSLRFSGSMEWCMTNCLETHRCIVVDHLEPCGTSPVSHTTWGRIRAIYR